MRRHRLDLFSLVTGVAFVAVAVLYLLESAGMVRVDGQLVIPLVLIALGAGGLAAALYRMAGDRGGAKRATGSDGGSEYAPYDSTGFDRPFSQSYGRPGAGQQEFDWSDTDRR